MTIVSFYKEEFGTENDKVSLYSDDKTKFDNVTLTIEDVNEFYTPAERKYINDFEEYARTYIADLDVARHYEHIANSKKLYLDLKISHKKGLIKRTDIDLIYTHKLNEYRATITDIKRDKITQHIQMAGIYK